MRWSLRDESPTRIPNFLSGKGATRDGAARIVEVIAEDCDGTELGERLEGPFVAFRDGSRVDDDEFREALAWGMDWLRASPVR